MVNVNNGQVYRGILDCFAKTYTAGGIRALYRGVGKLIKSAHTPITSMVVFLCWVHIAQISEFNSCQQQLQHWLAYSHMRV